MKKGDIVKHKVDGRHLIILKKTRTGHFLCKFWNEVKGRYDADYFDKAEVYES